MDTLRIERIEYMSKTLVVSLTDGGTIHVSPQTDGNGWYVGWTSGFYSARRAGACYDRTELGVQRALERLLEGQSPKWTS